TCSRSDAGSVVADMAISTSLSKPAATGSARERPLGAAGVIDEDGLELSEEVEPFCRHLAFTNTCGLGAPEGKLRLAADGRLVDVNHPGFDVLDELHDRVDVRSKNRGREAVLDRVGEAHRFGQVVRGDD